MGSQWSTMGKSLLKIPIVRESLRKSGEILLEIDVDLMNIITEKDYGNDDDGDALINSYVSIVAIQVSHFSK